MKTLQFIYGPVLSRRIGFSLGVDLVPYKTCSFDCIYCQLGRTTNKTVERKAYLSKNEILSQVKSALASGQKIDYVTFSGSGEPTLNSQISTLIKEIKKITDIPVAVITNSSLLHNETVRQAILDADLVLPSLDAATQKTFETINRPHPSLKIDKIIDGLIQFRQGFKGKIWLEIIFVKGVNDSLGEIEAFQKAIAKIKPDKIHLNTVVRPPAEVSAQPLTYSELQNIANLLGPNCEVVVARKDRQKSPFIENVEKAIVELVKRRPVTLSDIYTVMGIHRNEILKYLIKLEKEGKVKAHSHRGSIYYEKV